ncbi:hypothetical protein EV127DRAFT_507757 [Xylaria flabelliformis]|nr:hypothetical protein EV127DRAFT_507757 [Xylaria flabelliformis]
MPPTSFHKRKLPFTSLQRRVRARREEPEPELEEYSEDSQEEGSEDGDSNDMSDSEGQSAGESGSALGSEDDSEDEEHNPSSAVTQISFGALAKAQASMPSIRQKKKKGHKIKNDEDEDGEEEQEDHRRSSKPDSKSSKPLKPQRSSKHAPTEMSSKRMVSRKREVISIPKVLPRDPRFSAASGAIDETRSRKAYAFLDEYRDSEMADLKAAMKKTKSATEREELARTLKSMQSRKEAQARRDAERDLVAQHRRQEKELVAQGKKPFYLKKSEQKKQLLLERFAGMKKKQVDRTIERRRKKLTARERKNMPVARRGAT